MVEITLHRLRSLLRCPSCAGVPVPTDLPPLAAPTTTGGDLTPVAVTARTWLPYADGEDR